MIAYDVTRRCQQPRWRSVSPPFRIEMTRKDIVKDNKREQILYRKRSVSLRRVPAFTIQTEQQNTRPFTPATKKPTKSREDPDLERFIRIYEDRRLPLRLVETSGTGKSKTVEWQVDPNRFPPADARELLRQLAFGLSVEKKVSFKS
ncbi:hypothetical protein FO519_003210 [Halicephalobus sp. NKZ332]|nr:hypothetical protein FO519_003210 [Halicephalobus sp. NKZ332]